jgi:GTP pyrophosphokinase
VGFITRGRGVTVHTHSCEKALTGDPQRRVDVTWDVKGDFKRLVSLRVVTTDRPGLLAKISQAFGEAGINIAQANVRTGVGREIHSFEVAVGDLKQLTAVMKSIERIDGVFSVKRT